MMDFTILTIFPDFFAPFWEHGIIRLALLNKLINAKVLDLRDFTFDRHRTTDDKLYGGGCGMVMKPEPIALAIEEAKKTSPGAATIYLSPQGRPFDQDTAKRLSSSDGLILLCGRYEGVDERLLEKYVDEEISVGDFVLTGGELGAMMVVDAVARLIPGVLGGDDSADLDSFSDGLLEHAQYTRPARFEGEDVPEVLLSGNHGAIEQWRLESSLMRTLLKRPDLLLTKKLDSNEIDILEKWKLEIARIIQS